MDHQILTCSDADRDYLVRHYDDGTTTISTRPLGGHGWSPEVELTAQPMEAPC